MKLLRELLMERSNLGKVGVSKSDITRIHKDLLIKKHDSDFNPVTKSQAKAAAKNEQLVIAVNSKGQAFGIAYGDGDGRGVSVYVTPPKGSNVKTYSTLTDALDAIPGKEFKFFASSDRRIHANRFDRRYKFDPDENLIHEFHQEAVDKFNDVIKKDAQKAYKEVREYLKKQIDVEADKDHMGRRGGRSLDDIREQMITLKHVAKNGVASLPEDPFESRYNRIQRRVRRFFEKTTDWQTQDAIKEYRKNQKLAVQKYAQYMREEIKEFRDAALSGDWKNTPDKTAKYYKNRETAKKRAATRAANKKKAGSKKK